MTIICQKRPYFALFRKMSMLVYGSNFHSLDHNTRNFIINSGYRYQPENVTSGLVMQGLKYLCTLFEMVSFVPLFVPSTTQIFKPFNTFSGYPL